LSVVLVRASAGLSVAKKLMQKYSGKFQSQLASGEFIFELPSPAGNMSYNTLCYELYYTML